MDFTIHSSAGGNLEIGSGNSLVIIALNFDQCFAACITQHFKTLLWHASYASLQSSELLVKSTQRKNRDCFLWGSECLHLKRWIFPVFCLNEGLINGWSRALYEAIS